MKYNLVKDVVDLVAEFEESNTHGVFNNDINGFKKWVVDQDLGANEVNNEPPWEGKEEGRTADSVISTLIVHMNRFAKNYSKAAILDSEFSTQEDFIYLINLKAFGAMTKMELIKKNVHEKSVGILIINRLMAKGWLLQQNSPTDKRSKIIAITDLGLEVLEKQMHKIRQATRIVTGNLAIREKMQLITLLNKLSIFHTDIYDKNIGLDDLLEKALIFKK